MRGRAMQNNNIQNGGLICDVNETLIVGKVLEKRGMHWIEPEGSFVQNEVMPWFICSDEKGETIYYSDALKGNCLCKMLMHAPIGQVILEEPVYLLQSYEDHLYYLSEKNRGLYSYSLQEKQARKLIDEEITTFTVGKDAIWYGSSKGIVTCNLKGRESEKLCKNEACRIVINETQLAFVDKSNNYSVAYVKQENGEVATIPGSMATSANLYGDYVFYNHAKDKGHIHRYSMENEFDLKFIPEKADYIHIIGDYMFYLNKEQRQWMKVSVQGGKPKVLIDKREG